MTQPPVEPPEGPPGEPPGRSPGEGGADDSSAYWSAWQAPGPPPPPPPSYYATPTGQNPYGGGTASYYQSGGMSSGLKVGLGVVIGLVAGFFLWFVAIIVVTPSAGSTTEFLFLASAAPLVVPAVLLIWKATRPWAVGLLIGTAITSIGLSSLCAAVVGSLGGA